MMLRACVNARASSGTRSAFCPRYAIQRRRMCETSGRVTRPTPYMPLCTRSEVYIGLVCPGIGLSHGAADDAPRQGAGQVSQLTAGSEFAFERPMGGSHAAREECGDPKKSGFSLDSVPPCFARHRPSCRRETQPKTASAGKQQLVDHNSTIETQISDRASCNFLLWWLQLICVGSRNSTSSRRRAPCTTSIK